MAGLSKRVLIVEDDAALSDAFDIVLSKNGYTTDRAYNGQEALDHIQANEPDIILLDLLMPVMDGKEFLKGFDNPKHIPIIVLSNLDAKSEIQEILDLGASRYMLKAWASPAELVKLVEETLN